MRSWQHWGCFLLLFPKCSVVWLRSVRDMTAHTRACEHVSSSVLTFCVPSSPTVGERKWEGKGGEHLDLAKAGRSFGRVVRGAMVRGPCVPR